jgi:hypothetical protein
MAVLLFACNTLDVPPMNIVKDADLFNDQSGVTAYIAELYRTMPMTDRQDYGARGMDMSVYDALPDDIANVSNHSNATNAWWSYECIRSACYFLQEFPAYKSKFTETMANAWMGETYFIRAFCYFRMVQCYGGVPIVDRVLNYPQESIEELKLPRNKEVDCYDFILADLEEAIRLLPETSESSNGLALGRVNKYIALAFKARVALTAGCIAKYGGETLSAYASDPAVQGGLAGIPASKANGYFEVAWTAAKAVEASGRYELYGANLTDPEAVMKSYRKLYQDVSTANKETMFARYFKYGINPTILSANCLPYQLGGTYPMHVNPTMDFVRLFDDVNGNPINWNEKTGTDATYSNHLYADPADAFADMEPRFKAIIAYPNSSYKGEIIDIRKGILEKDKFSDGAAFSMDNVKVSADMAQRYEGMLIQGRSGMGFTDVTSTGFYCVKYPDENMPRTDVSSSNSKDVTPMVEIRYAEVLLTLAEAAVELGRPNDAIPYMNAIRKRAGSKKTFSTVTLEDVRKERRMEFIWECKTYWDLKRWRTFHREFDNTALQIMWPIYVWDKEAYYLRILDTGVSNGKLISFNPQHYYLRVPDGEITKNGNLIQNPGY